MWTAQHLILLSGNALVVAVLIGLVWRRRLRLLYSFPVYLVSVVVLSPLAALWPERFHTWSFYWLKQWIYGVLEMAIAIELAIRVFQAFPAARRAARMAFALVLVVTILAVWSAPTGQTAGMRVQQQWADLVLSLHPRIANGTAWLFGSLFALILYYRLPLHPLHKAVAFGFMASLLLLTFVLDQVRRSDFAALSIMSYAGSVGYSLIAACWAWVARRPDDAPSVDQGVVDRLQPWR